MSDLSLVGTPAKSQVLDRLRDFARNSALLRKVLVLALLALIWEFSARFSAKPILFPTFTATMAALWEALTTENLLTASWTSLTVLLKGYVMAIAAAFAIVSLAVVSRFVRELLQTLISMFNPLPAIALLPLAMLWFGLGERSLLVVLVHAVLWPFALATLSGFESVPETQRLVGRNYGLNGPGYVWRILIPAALPSILYGMKIAWAFAWRTLIAAELVFGVSSSTGGLGWFIFRNRNELFTDKVFAGLAMVIIIGLVVEGVVFRLIENVTVRRWGMQR
ncbi:ABC transporter permease [Rhizobium sp. LC145]|jgi:NitT/TauT family transport system permease protein|uniref:ABC transporter permease n=1 Tax=Rhizobium sp. LC145 TaxID=1120688 RepID=UPI00062A3AEE|nr:ABC transporter permease [Rhizobium sp. LC145]KKX27163.1 ABC transporter permease [Rhizobium sp. LC145]TKT57694.1 ABC transporter permease [Rhizobiaceae bacterium LC148]